MLGGSLREVQRFLAGGRISGDDKEYGNYRMIPADIEKPVDPHKVRELPCKKECRLCVLTRADLPKNNPDAALPVAEAALHPLAIAVTTGSNGCRYRCNVFHVAARQAPITGNATVLTIPEQPPIPTTGEGTPLFVLLVLSVAGLAASFPAAQAKTRRKAASDWACHPLCHVGCKIPNAPFFARLINALLYLSRRPYGAFHMYGSRRPFTLRLFRSLAPYRFIARMSCSPAGENK